MFKADRHAFIIGGILCALTILLIIAIGNTKSDQQTNDLLYEALDAYAHQQVWELPAGVAFSEDPAEELLVQGIEAYDAKDYERAKDFFTKALGRIDHDADLSAWLYFYINRCDYFLTGSGDFETIALAFEAIRQCPALCNNTDMLGDMIDTVINSKETFDREIELLQEHLEKTDNLQELSEVRIKNMIGMLEYLNKDYTKSIQQFYDVEILLENTKRTEELESEYLYAKEFIANIYFMLQNYEAAAEKYQDVIDFTLADGYLYPYGSSVNLINVYLEISDVKRAKEALKQLEQQFSHLEEEIRPEIKACMDDAYANVDILEGNYEEAQQYLDQAEAYYRENEGELFLDGECFVTFTRCKYLYATGKYEESQKVLEQLLEKGNPADCGVEQNVYELLQQIYKKTGQTEKLIQMDETILNREKEFSKTIQSEYLMFSEYYQKNQQLRLKLEKVLRTRLSFLMILLVSLGGLIATLLVLHSLAKKNITDQLTKVYNRKKLDALRRRYERKGTPEKFGVMMLDIDHFKLYNDTYGHPAGDQVLKQVAMVLRSAVDNKAKVIRYGGEEFLILWQEVQLQTVKEACFAIQEGLRKLAIPHAASETSKCVTVSMGLWYQTKTEGFSLERLIKCADECLYEAKETGRNRFIIEAV